MITAIDNRERDREQREMKVGIEYGEENPVLVRAEPF